MRNSGVSICAGSLPLQIRQISPHSGTSCTWSGANSYHALTRFAGFERGKQTELATFRQGQEDRQFESTPLQRAVTANLPAAIRKPAIGSALQLDGSHQISTALRYPCSATLGFPPSTRRRSGSPATRSSASHQVFEIWGFISLCTWPGASRCTRGCPL